MTKVKVRIPINLTFSALPSKEEMFEGELMGIFQYSEPVGESPLVGGHAAGVIAYPVAVVKYKNQLRQVPVKYIEYID